MIPRDTSLRVVLLAAFASFSAGASAQTIYVDANATGSPNDGSSWCNAYTQLYEALAVAAPGAEIKVAGATYLPDTSGLGDPREATFQLANGASMQGGFAGCGAPDPDEVDGWTYQVILSGDIGIPGDPSDNAYHVVTGSGVDESTLLDFFFIQNGRADGASPHDNGGGMIIVDGSPDVLLTIFSDNIASQAGGAVFIEGTGTPFFHAGCEFIQNSATFGGGMRVQPGASVSLLNSTFDDNAALAEGGGLNLVGASAEIRRCTFSNNTVTSGSGGGIWDENSSSLVVACRFLGNSASIDGGGYFSIFGNSNPQFINCLFSGNSAVFDCGALCTLAGATASLTNCTLVDNTCQSEGGGIYSETATVVTNSVFWGNSDQNGSVEDSQIWVAGGVLTINHSCVENLTGFWGGTGNIGDDPMFVDAGNGDYHLQQSSLCIDVGDNAVVTEQNDLDGDTRIVDGDSNGSAIVDMGAYEYQASAAIPTVSEWGMVVMTLFVLVAGTVVLATSRRARA